jgi:hypothetical protein
MLKGLSGIDTAVEWAEWSPNVTTCIPLNSHTHSTFRSTFGSCILALGRPLVTIEDPAGDDYFLMLLDFNPIPIQRGCEERTEEDYYLRLVHEQTEWYTDTPRLPEHTTSTNHPCRVFMRRWGPHNASLLLEANTIILRMVRHFYSAISVKIFAY